MATIEMISSYLTGLGSTVLLSIIIAVLGLILGQKLGKAIISGLMVGVGFVGLGLVIGLLIGSLAPATDALIAKTGLELTAIDVGWGVAAAIAFGTVVGALVIPVVFLLNIIYLVLKVTQDPQRGHLEFLALRIHRFTGLPGYRTELSVSPESRHVCMRHILC